MSRKGENIYKRKDGRWEGRYIKSYSPTGKAKYGYVYSKSYREVKTKVAQAICSNEKKQDSLSHFDGTIYFKNYAEEWLFHRQAQIKESTYIRYKNLLDKYILPILGHKPLCALTCDVIEFFCNDLLLTGGIGQDGLSTKMVSDILSLLRNILKSAVSRGIYHENNFSSIKIKQISKEMRVLSLMEQECLCRHLYSNLNYSNIGILLCLFTGLRVGEVCALRWTDISLNECCIHVRQTMQRIQTPEGFPSKTKILISAPKSGCSVRTIPLQKQLLDILRGCQHTPNGYLLTGNDNSFIEPRTMQNHFKQVLRECRISNANFHCLRHTFATRCVELGFDVKSLSEILGHASVSITMNRYVHPTLELKRNNMERLSELFAVK